MLAHKRQKAEPRLISLAQTLLLFLASSGSKDATNLNRESKQSPQMTRVYAKLISSFVFWGANTSHPPQSKASVPSASVPVR